MNLNYFFRFLLICPAILLAQNLNIKGRILEKASMVPVQGAVIHYSGTSYGTVSGADGKFVLTPNSTTIKIDKKNETSFQKRAELFIRRSDHIYENSTVLFDLLGQRTESSSLPLSLIHSHSVSKTYSAFEIPYRPQPLAKVAGGSLEVSMDKLISKTVPVSLEVADVGDIILEYPVRQKIGVGAPMPYGAEMYFDGSHGKVAATAELAAKWQDWLPATTPDDLKNYTDKLHQFKIMKDPEFETDTNRVTLMSCCNSNWGYDDIQTIKTHGDAQIHVEFNLMGQYDTTENTNANDGYNGGQPGYENSGVYVQSRYEVQILAIGTDPGYHPTTHEMGALVDDYSPDKNMNKKNGLWQSYDITFRQARYDNSKKMIEDGRMSVWWNGVLVHNNRIAHAPATGIGKHSGEEMTPIEYGLKLQSEGTDVRFRNIWIKPLAVKDTLTAFGY